MPIRTSLLRKSLSTTGTKHLAKQPIVTYRAVHSTMSSSFTQNPHKLLV